METDSSKKYYLNSSEKKKLFSNSSNLRELIRVMQESFLNDSGRTHNTVENFNWSNKKRISGYGYDIKKKEKLIINNSVYRKNRILHKLIRIQKEFQFVKINNKNYQGLTGREKEIIQLLATGYNNPMIAKKLFISRHTVEKHRKNIYFKLEIKSFAHLMRYVYAFDLI